MPLIQQAPKIEKAIVKIKIPDPLRIQVEAYCEWAGIDDIGYFFTEAAEHIFNSDLEWKKHAEAEAAKAETAE